MKKHLLLLAMTFIMVIAKSNAQTYLYVYEPISAKANFNYGAMSNTTGSWAAIIDTIGAVGEIVLARSANNDSLVCDTTILTNVAGKIALVYRGACEFGVKALAAQRAGAVGVIIVNNVIGGPIGLLAGGAGGTVSIPVLSVTNEDGKVLRQLLTESTVRAVIGNKSGLYTNDVGFYPEHVSRFKHYHMPETELDADTLVQVRPEARVRNWGTGLRTNVQVTATISRNGTTLYTQVASLPSLAPETDSLLTFPVFNPNTSGKGDYELNYAVQADGTDEFTADNTVSTKFVIGDTLLSKTPLTASGDPMITNYVNNINSSNYEYGITFYAARGADLRVDKVRFAATKQSTDSMINETVVGRLYEWIDADASTTMDASELVQLGEGFYSYTADDKGVVKEMEIQDIFSSQTGIRLTDGSVYMITLFVPGTDTLFLATYDRNVDYTLSVPTYGERISPIFTDQWYADGFGREVSPAMSVIFANVSGVSVEENKLNKIEMGLYPNPAKESIYVRLLAKQALGNLNYDIYDITGRLVKSGVRSIEAINDDFSVDINDLKSGTYSMVVRSNSGFNTARFVVVH